MEACDQDNRRRFARLDIALSVSYAIMNSGGGASEMAEAMSSDISAGGLRLMTPAPLPNGATLDLEISMNGEEETKIHASGEVVWQSQIAEDSYETGAIIKHMDDSDKKLFMGFIFDQMSRLVGERPSQLN